MLAGKLAVRQTLESMAPLGTMDAAMVAAEEWLISVEMAEHLAAVAEAEEFMLALKIIQVVVVQEAKLGFLVGR